LDPQNAFVMSSVSENTKKPLYNMSMNRTYIPTSSILIFLYRLTRRDMETYAGRYWRYENAFISLFPVDENQPRLGGKVRVKVLAIDWRTFTPSWKTLHGVYSDDFITFGEFKKEAGDPFHDEELLLKIVDQEDKSVVVDKTTFRFENNSLHFKKEVNGELADTEINQPVPETKLTPQLDQSWGEVFFYGLGNKNM